MTHRLPGAIAALLLASVSVAGQAPSSVAKTKTTTATAKTPWGDPDLQGTWANNSATPLERPKQLEGRQFLTDQEVSNLRENAAKVVYGDESPDGLAGDAVFMAALTKNKAERAGGNGRGVGLYNQFWFVQRDFDNRTSLIVDPPDGRIPPMTPEAAKREAAKAEYQRAHAADSVEDIPLSLRCITRGLPGGLFIAGYNSNYQILQTPGYVAIHMEMFHDVRVIPLDGRPHLGTDTARYLGDSRGHWEGDTLVIDTINFSPKSDFRGSNTNLHLVERFTRVAPNAVNYELTMSDPTTWTRPWTVVLRLKQTQEKIYEFACHEGNYSIQNVLTGARFQEKVAEAAKK